VSKKKHPASAEVCRPFDRRMALDPDAPPPPPLPKPPARRSAALLVPCPDCGKVQGDWCKPDAKGQTRNVHTARLGAAAKKLEAEVTGPFSPERAVGR
jgi:hypothetical protein